jgi:hypothetical protein
MKKILLIFIVGLLISSCNTIGFKSSLPKDTEILTQFPDDIIGIYFDGEKDTLRIYTDSFEYGIKDSSMLYMNKKLEKGLVELKPFGEYYILSIKSESNEKIWGILPFKKDKNKVIVYFNDLDIKAKELKVDLDSIVKITQKITPIEVVKEEGNEQAHYFADPTNEEFKKLLDENYFGKAIEFKRIK